MAPQSSRHLVLSFKSRLLFRARVGELHEIYFKEIGFAITKSALDYFI